MMGLIIRVRIASAALLCWSVGTLTGLRAEAGMLPGNARIVFIGDSITGQGQNHAQGFVQQIASALRQAQPGNTMQFVALGGSGQSVGSWLNVETQSRQTNTCLDVPNVGVQTNLDLGADVLVVMLGMNDVIAPYVSEDPQALAAWRERYRLLLQALRARVRPRLLALATITLATEESGSPKNQVAAALNRQLAELARAECCLLLPTHEAMRAMLDEGRRYRPDFHVTGDGVHPNAAGHLAIAVGMLRGLGEEAAAQTLLQQDVAAPRQMFQAALPTLSYTLEPLTAAPGGDTGQLFRLRYSWMAGPGRATNPPCVRLDVPADWDVAPREQRGATGAFLLTGRPERLRNLLTLRADDGLVARETQVCIPAPWWVGTGVPNPAAWPGHQFNPVSGRLPIDEAISHGTLTPEGAPAWQLLFPSVAFTGGAEPGSVDFWAASFGRTFEAGYGMRWITSARERPVTLILSTRIFAGTIGLTVWLNGAQLYGGTISGEPGKLARIPATLRQGENSLVFKCNHLTWQWQAQVAIEPVAGDTLDDLRYAAASRGSQP